MKILVTDEEEVKCRRYKEEFVIRTGFGDLIATVGFFCDDWYLGEGIGPGEGGNHAGKTKNA
jgi:hypothetical protein